MFICWLSKKKYKELKLAKLEFHITRNSSLVSSSTIEEKKKSITLEFCIYKELELSKLEYCVAWNSSLASSSSMWHFFNKKIHVSTRIFFMKLECLKLDLYSKLEFQKSGIFLLILQTMVCCCKVEFYQLSYWLYSVPNLLVFQ